MASQKNGRLTRDKGHITRGCWVKSKKQCTLNPISKAIFPRLNMEDQVLHLQFCGQRVECVGEKTDRSHFNPELPTFSLTE